MNSILVVVPEPDTWLNSKRRYCGLTAVAVDRKPILSGRGVDPSRKPCQRACQDTAAPPKTAPAAAGDAVFPTVVSPKYSSESAGKARMHTCLDQYNANKASNANGGLVWIKKGGGYYSECNRHLKG